MRPRTPHGRRDCLKGPPSTAETSVLPRWEHHFAKTQKTLLSTPGNTKKPPLQTPRCARKPRRPSKRAQGHRNGAPKGAQNTSKSTPRTIPETVPKPKKNEKLISRKFLENELPVETGTPFWKNRKRNWRPYFSKMSFPSRRERHFQKTRKANFSILGFPPRREHYFENLS